MEKIKINYKKVLILIFILSSLLRIFFVYFSRIDQFQYDVGTMDLHTPENYEKIYLKDKDVFLPNRHLDYILKIYEKGKLPENNDTQLYHPPLHHIISAIWLKVIDIFSFTAETKLESLQIITCIYSIITLLIIWKILIELDIDDKRKLIVIGICGFHPIFIYMSGLINNDTLLTMFSVWSLLYIIKWYKNPNYKYAIVLAIIIGLGTLTKSSMTVNFVIAGIIFFIKFLIVLYNEEYKKVKEIILQGLVLILIALPLMLSFQIRNYILFEQDFFVVHEAAEWLYVGNDNLNERIGIFNKDLLNNTIGFKDQNILSYVIKSAIVFEVNKEAVWGTTFLKWISIIFIMSTIISSFSLFFSKDKKNYILISFYFVWIVFFFSFNFQMPNSCSMHARYIITPIIVSSICLTKFLENKKLKMTNFYIFLTLLFDITSSIVVIQNIL